MKQVKQTRGRFIMAGLGPKLACIGVRSGCYCGACRYIRSKEAAAPWHAREQKCSFGTTRCQGAYIVQYGKEGRCGICNTLVVCSEN